MSLKEKIRKFDESYDDLPRKIFLVGSVFFVTFAAFCMLPYLWPFILGLLFAVLMDPMVRFVTRLFSKLRCGKKIAIGISMLLVYGLIGIVLTMLFRQIYIELERLVKALPDILDYVENIMQEWSQKANPEDSGGINTRLSVLLDKANEGIVQFVQNFIGKATPTVASGAIGVVASLPKVILFIVMTVMSSFYFVSDKERIRAYLEKLLPSGVVHRTYALSGSVWSAVGQQVRAQIFISFCIMVMLIIGFYIIRVEYAFVLGIVIGFIDVLPIVGAGTVLIPWGLFNLLAGNISLGLKLAGLYVAVVALRQVIEPRIVGHKLGLYPLVTMLSMYVGMKLTGFVGLIVGPVLANICKVVLVSDANIRKAQRAEQSRQENSEKVVEKQEDKTCKD
ncbi:MAG: sporulation integral membrane protein YtvI [Eubacteriales bacterium]|nr:sporulation integral membrane protein YtvI [Eubacteriales bacterium]